MPQQIAALAQGKELSLRPAMLTISKVAELKLLTPGIVNDGAEAACSRTEPSEPAVVVVVCRELAFSTRTMLVDNTDSEAK